MPGEAFSNNEKYLSWVAASGVSGGFITADKPKSALDISFLRSVNIRSGVSNLHVRDHGVIVQTKFGQQEPSQLDFTYDTTGSGLPVSGLTHFELALITQGSGTSAWARMSHARHINRQVAASEGSLIMITDTYEYVRLDLASSGILIS